MLARTRFAMIGAGFTMVIGGAVFVATSTAATRPAVTPTASPKLDSTLSAKDRAAVAALAKVSGGTVKKSKTECEDGRLVYSFQIASATGVVKVSVDALTGVASAKAEDEDDDAPKSVEGGKKAHHEDADANEQEDEDDDGACTAGHHAAKTVGK